MGGDTSTPESKPRKANPDSTDRNKHQQRRQPRRHDQQQTNAHPEWDNQNGSGADVSGDFDENGQFVMKGPPSGAKNIKKPKGKPKVQNQTQPQAIPAWDHAPAQSAEGYFDANGHFIMSNNTESGPMSANLPKTKGKTKQAAQNIPNPPSGVTPIPASPSRPMGFGSTPMKAYAGPTFHASPAASELPIPKFFSQSVPKEVNQSGFSSMLKHEESQDEQNEQKDTSSIDSSPRLVPAHANKPVQRNESPLDIFFNADRAEKAAKAKRQSMGDNAHQKPNTQSNSTHWASIYGPRPKHNRNYSTGSTKDIFSMDLENDAASMRANFDPHSPSKFQMRTPETTPDPTRRFGQSEWNSPGSPTDRPVSVPAPTHAPYPFTPRSVGSTPPVPQHMHGEDQPVNHYGNRNLSPLFTAMKTDSVRRQSGLRKEVTRSPQTKSEPFGAAQAKADAKISAMDLLNAQIAKSANRPFDTPFTGGFVPPATTGVGQSPSQVHPSNANAKADGNPVDLKSMENDLKRMLNLSGSAGFPGY